MASPVQTARAAPLRHHGGGSSNRMRCSTDALPSASTARARITCRPGASPAQTRSGFPPCSIQPESCPTSHVSKRLPAGLAKASSANRRRTSRSPGDSRGSSPASGCHAPSRRTARASTTSAGSRGGGSATIVSSSITEPSARAAASTPLSPSTMPWSRNSWLESPSESPKLRSRPACGSHRCSPRVLASQARPRGSTARPEPSTAGRPSSLPAAASRCQRPSASRYCSSPDRRCSHSSPGEANASAKTRSPVGRPGTGAKAPPPAGSMATPKLPDAHNPPDGPDTSDSSAPSGNSSPGPPRTLRRTLPVPGSRCCSPEPAFASHRVPSGATSRWSTWPSIVGSYGLSGVQASNPSPSGSTRASAPGPLPPIHSRPTGSSTMVSGRSCSRRSQRSGRTGRTRPSGPSRSSWPPRASSHNPPSRAGTTSR